MIRCASCEADEEFYQVLREGRHRNRKLKGIPRKLVPSPIPYSIIPSSLILLWKDIDIISTLGLYYQQRNF